MMRLRISVGVACLLALVALPAAAAIQSTVIGTGTPPPTLGGIPMIRFMDDTRTLSNLETTVPTPIGGDLVFDTACYHVKVNQGWNNWSNGYLGDVYYLPFSTSASSLTITLPAGTGAFGLYTEADLYGTFSFTVTSSTATQTFNVTTPGGAVGVGFWDDAGGTLTSVTVSAPASFAVGEFGIAPQGGPIPALGAVGLVVLALALALAGIVVARRFLA